MTTVNIEVSPEWWWADLGVAVTCGDCGGKMEFTGETELIFLEEMNLEVRCSTCLSTGTLNITLL